MNETNSEGESVGKNDSHRRSNEENYESYQLQNLPEGYTGYREPNQVAENDYDRYDSDYEASETPQQENKTCPEIALAFKLIEKNW